MTSIAIDDPSPPWKSFEEMRAFLGDHLDHSVPEDQIQKLQSIKADFKERQARLQNMLLNDEIDKRRYLAEFTRAMEQYMQANREILGDTDFSAVFGQAGYDPGKLIDREVFLSQG